ncbi:MAG: DUF6178 family protein [Pseudomonadota bacterium]
MPRRSLVRSGSSTRLLHQLVDHADLPALVARLNTRTLTQVIDQIGVAESGPIIAATTPQQMQRLFDEKLWQALGTEATERLSSEAFVEWLEVLLEQGATFTAERIALLGLNFAIAQFARLIEVFDTDRTLIALDADAETFGACRVVPRTPEYWDPLRATLLALADDEAEFLEALLRGLVVGTSRGATQNDALTASADAAEEREQRREADGYVTRASAREFLATARTLDLADIADLNAYSPALRRYFQARSDAPPDIDTATAASVAELERLLAQINSVDTQLRLPQGETSELPLKTLLDELQSNAPIAFERRVEELAYLGNVLIVGAVDCEFTETEAANAALSTANLGAAYLLSQQQVPIDALLRSEPGLIRAFSAGLNILQQIALRTARAVAAVLRDKTVRGRLGARAWLLDDVDSALAELVTSVDLGAFPAAHEALVMASLLFEPEMGQRLKLLVNEYPRLPGAVVPGERVHITTRNFDSLDDLQQVDALLQSLADHIKL